MPAVYLEDGLRRFAPLFRSYPRYKDRSVVKSPANLKEYQQGRMVTVVTKRDVYQEYKHILGIVYRRLATSAILWIIGGFLFMRMLNGGGISYSVLATITLMAAVFYYRHGFGKYGDIADWEEQPVALPPRSMIDEAEKQGVDITRLGNPLLSSH